jgi:hypothetical protein
LEELGDERLAKKTFLLSKQLAASNKKSWVALAKKSMSAVADYFIAKT